MRTVYITVRIDYTCNESECDYAEEIAIDLAINPNYATVEEGVQLQNVEVCGINED